MSRKVAETRWVVVGAVVVGVLFFAEIAAGYVRQAVSHPPSTLEKVETCLQERSTPFDLDVDPVARAASRGALRTTVAGNEVVMSLGGSENEAQKIFDDYAAVAAADVVATRLERNRKVVLLWSAPPTAEQREFMRLCALDAQE